MNEIRFFFRKIKIYIKNKLYFIYAFKPVNYKYFPKAILALYLPENPVMLDCGAHDGFDSIELIKAIGGKLYAVEAIPAIYDKLVKNTKELTSIKAFNLALTNKTGKVNFHLSVGNDGASSSILTPREHLIDHPEITFEENIEVDCDTLDNWANRNNINYIDFMWLDMQGAEKLMLEASKKIIKTVKAIHCEISMKETYESVPLYEDFVVWMKKKGFRPELIVIEEGYDMGDVLFLRYRKDD